MAAALTSAIQQRWSHLSEGVEGMSPEHRACIPRFLSMLKQSASQNKTKHKTEFVAALADYFSKGKGPDNKPMTSDQVG